MKRSVIIPGRFLIVVVTVLLCIISQIGQAQENARFRVPKLLEQCYRAPELLQRDNRLPMTIETLIDLIRKVENSQGYTQDIRQLAISLVHRFRADGIVKAPGVATTPSVLPYSPAGFQFSKHRILLTRLIPGNGYSFPNNTLSPIEECTLHSMLSSSFQMEVRGDEGQRCSQLAAYRSVRVPRSSGSGLDIKPDRNNFIGDIEYLEKYKNKEQHSGKLRISTNIEPKDNTEDEDYDFDGHSFDTFSMVDMSSDAASQCPVENGVIRTKWGAVAAGPLITGIAAGLEPQKVQLRTLLSMSSRRPAVRQGQQLELNIDSKWASTLAGDLAEVALIQVPIYEGRSTVGASGAWNNTVKPKWYFLSAREKLEMTDAEIRGGIDGLIIASKITEWRSKSSNFKLSEVLSSYYSHKGVLGSGIRACDRKKFFTEFAPIEEMKRQTYAFARILDREMQLKVTIEEEAIKKFSDQAAEKLSTYIPSSLNDLSCEATTSTPDNPNEIDVASDLVIYLDTTWPYEEISDMLNNVVQQLNVNPFGSRVTLKSAANANLITGTTDSISDFHQSWNKEKHEEQRAGFKLPEILKDMQNISRYLMQDEKVNSSMGGRSLVALIVPYMTNVEDGDTNFAIERLWRMREEIPDLKILFYAAGSVGRFSRFVEEDPRDLFTARQDTENSNRISPLVKRITEIPRRIINYRCGPDWQPDNWGPTQNNQYVTPGTVKYYRLAANYYFGESNGRKMRFQGQGNTPISICSSRISENPRFNMSNKPTDLNCHHLTSNAVEFDLSNPCEGYFEIHKCPPYHVSLEANQQLGDNSQTPCIDKECESSNQIRFSLITENLGCFSGVSQNLANALFVSVLALITSVRTFGV